MRSVQLSVSLLVIGLLGLCDCYKVLLVFPFPGKSHGILGDGYKKILLKAGHEITYVTPFPDKNPPKNLTQVDLSSLIQDELPFNIPNIINNKIDLMDYNFVYSMMYDLSKMVVLHDNVQALLHDKSKQFDVVIAEWMFTELYAGFANVFNCPLIWSSSIEPHWQILELIGEEVSPAVLPDALAMNVTPFSFWERLNSLWQITHTKFSRFSKFMPMASQIHQEAFSTAAAARGVQLLPYEKMRLNASLVLGNSHIATGQAFTLPGAYIPIGGYHIIGEEEELKPDLKKIMDTSTHGVIYFSMGSVLKSKDMPEDMKKGLIEVFGKLKQTVLWKMEENLNNLPKNVHVLQWAPQRSILKHPNTVLFITHGGLLSTTEALYYGVPLIGIPAFGDQYQNVARSVKKGYAVGVPLSRGLATDLEGAIQKMLSDDKYKKTVRFLSWVFKSGYNSADALTHGVSLAVEGPNMLRPPVPPFYQAYYLDAAAMILAGLLASTWALCNLLKSSKKSSGRKQKAL